MPDIGYISDTYTGYYFFMRIVLRFAMRPDTRYFQSLGKLRRVDLVKKNLYCIGNFFYLVDLNLVY